MFIGGSPLTIPAESEQAGLHAASKLYAFPLWEDCTGARNATGDRRPSRENPFGRRAPFLESLIGDAIAPQEWAIDVGRGPG